MVDLFKDQQFVNALADAYCEIDFDDYYRLATVLADNLYYDFEFEVPATVETVEGFLKAWEDKEEELRNQMYPILASKTQFYTEQERNAVWDEYLTQLGELRRAILRSMEEQKRMPKPEIGDKVRLYGQFAVCEIADIKSVDGIVYADCGYSYFMDVRARYPLDQLYIVERKGC